MFLLYPPRNASVNIITFLNNIFNFTNGNVSVSYLSRGLHQALPFGILGHAFPSLPLALSPLPISLPSPLHLPSSISPSPLSPPVFPPFPPPFPYQQRKIHLISYNYGIMHTKLLLWYC